AAARPPAAAAATRRPAAGAARPAATAAEPETAAAASAASARDDAHDHDEQDEDQQAHRHAATAATAGPRARGQLALGVLVSARRRVDRRQALAQPAFEVALLEARLHQLAADAPGQRVRQLVLETVADVNAILAVGDGDRHQHAVVVLGPDLPLL